MSEDIGAWFAGRVPKTWFAGPPEVTSDSEEILVVGELPDVELAAGTAPEAREAARVARIDRFREESRLDRVKIAREAERRFRRKVAWGARCGDETRVFTTLSLPVMTRLPTPWWREAWPEAAATPSPGASAWWACTNLTGSKGCARPS